jgi:hypothetical protein
MIERENLCQSDKNLHAKPLAIISHAKQPSEKKIRKSDFHNADLIYRLADFHVRTKNDRSSKKNYKLMRTKSVCKK